MILIYAGLIMYSIVVVVLLVAITVLYDRSDLISFGNYLLSEKRDKCTSCECKLTVTHADIENWKTIVSSEYIQGEEQVTYTCK